MSPRAARSVSTSFGIERFTLDNGLRVVVNPDRSSPCVAVAVLYDVGFRSEPEGRTGFAHLFEHLMFQGSRSLPKGEFDKLIDGNGGSNNGMTRHDYTAYYEVMPSNALEIALFCEADRMDQVLIAEETLRNQLDVVKEEIKVNVHNAPYGGFPWLHLAPLMFETFANAHDGYGSFEDLEAATTKDAEAFFERFYAPANAVLVVAGDVETDVARKLVEHHFGRVPQRPAPDRPDFAEPPLLAVRRGSVTDPHAPRPALALGYRVPHPITAFADYLATVVLADALGVGDEGSRLYKRLAKNERLATHVQAYVGTFGDWAGMRDPTMLEILAYYVDPADTDRIIAIVDEECARIATDVTVEEIERVTSSFVSSFLQEQDQLVYRTLNLAVFEQQRGQAELVNDVPSLLAAITPDEVAAAASTWLEPSSRAVLEWRAGAP